MIRKTIRLLRAARWRKEDTEKLCLEVLPPRGGAEQRAGEVSQQAWPRGHLGGLPRGRKPLPAAWNLSRWGAH